MTERVALITGGARGIGRTIALDLAAEGWSVAVCYRTSERDGQETLQGIKRAGARGLAERADVSDPKAAAALVQKVQREWGRIDALIHCAGPYHRVNLLEETAEGWNEMFDNNLHPIFYVSKEAIPGMQERRWGRIITFSVANADQMIAQPRITGHYISKVGILVLTRTLARMLAPYGITANAISPGFLDSGSAPPEELQDVVRRIPAGYIGETRDASNIVRFLLSDEARYINGANIHLSGGWGI